MCVNVTFTWYFFLGFLFQISISLPPRPRFSRISCGPVSSFGAHCGWWILDMDSGVWRGIVFLSTVPIPKIYFCLSSFQYSILFISQNLIHLQATHDDLPGNPILTDRPPEICAFLNMEAMAELWYSNDLLRKATSAKHYCLLLFCFFSLSKQSCSTEIILVVLFIIIYRCFLFYFNFAILFFFEPQIHWRNGWMCLAFSLLFFSNVDTQDQYITKKTTKAFSEVLFSI